MTRPGLLNCLRTTVFFTTTEIPQGMELTINEKGEPILIEVNQSQGIQATQYQVRCWYLLPLQRRYNPAQC